MLPSPGVKNDRGSRAEGTTKGLPTDKLGDAEERTGKSRGKGLVDRNRKHGAVESKAPSRFTYRVLYLFAGGERKTSVVEPLRKILLTKGWDLEAVEVDLKRGDQWDLSDECANLRGPPPLRTKEHPWGFPWVSRKWGKELHLGNILVKFSIRVWSTVCRCPVSFDGYVIFLFGEHPEDLGAVIREEDRVKLVPASIWQLSEIINLVNDPNNAIRTVAINQCCWGTPWRKPTRLLSNSPVILAWGSNEWPTFDHAGYYQGPLEKSCSCTIQVSLARRSGDSGFRTAGTDAYPAALDAAIAEAAVTMISGQVPRLSSPKEGSQDIQRGTLEEEVHKTVQTGSKSGSVARAAEEATQGSAPVLHRQGVGASIKCVYKGRRRTIHDGGGLCSPGRWPVEARTRVSKEEGTQVVATCKTLFLKWVLEQGRKEGDAVKEVFWKLAGGKTKGSPFVDFMDKARQELDTKLEALGFKPKRQERDRISEVNFRRLKAMLEAVDDEDSDWIDEVAGRGVKLGVDRTMPRVPLVFEEKENSVDIKRQVMEEVEAGTIIEMSAKEAASRYQGKLAVAALGAVPKELGSSVVRIVHDGSFSVDVNHRIKVLDRMRFPSIDDAAGILAHVEDEIRSKGGGARCSLLYDISRAHKLLPVDEDDWGYQAFRLPGENQEDKVYLHTRGTFGIASAAYHWQRLAANVVRLLHRLLHRLGTDGLGVLHLLFADDGWLTATGEYFWRRLLYWVFLLDLLEIPLSWKKVRGGLKLQWIGYQLDLDAFEKGISERKVQWVIDWITKHRASGGVTGRELKSALGRFCFVAGALHHVRPFLGPLFAWSSVLAMGTFARFPDAVSVLLDFVEEEIRKEPMSKPKRLSDEVVEAFRVDAEAEGEKIVIGGWEVNESGLTSDARWFSITLTRKNAPWAYLKGQPFRNIASLELTAVLTAVMLFGDSMKKKASRRRLTLTAATDNLGNTYVLNHFMSCKYPLSIVVMELSVQLRKYDLDMDLGWVPRAQNTEADALTNEEFSGFDPGKRIEVNFEEIKFLIMDKMMGRAAELDSDIRLAKSSKEAKGDRPEESCPKRRRGQTRVPFRLEFLTMSNYGLTLVATWLREQEVSGQVLRSLDEAELAAMGLEPFGRRRQLLLCREEVLAEERKEVKEKKASLRSVPVQMLLILRDLVFQASHKENHCNSLDEAGRNRYADASLEKSSWPEVMKGLEWCKQQLEQVACDGDAIHVLDIGSCNNAAGLQHHNVRVTALDLCPRHPSVLQCNFLQLEVLPRTKRPLREGPKLLGLPAESFDVCLFSMVLHHWSQDLQQDGLEKAYELLVHSGILLVIENRAWNDHACLSHSRFALETEQRIRRTSLRALRLRALTHEAATQWPEGPEGPVPGARENEFSRQRPSPTRPSEDKSQHSQHTTKVAKAMDFVASLPTPARALCKRVKLKDEEVSILEDPTQVCQELLQVPEETPAEISPTDRAVAKETAQLIKECGDVEVVHKRVSKTLHGRDPLTGRPESHPGIQCSHTLSRCFHQQCLPGFSRHHGHIPVRQLQWAPRNLGICSPGRAVSWMPPRWVQSPLAAYPSTRTISWMPVPIKGAMHSWAPLRPRLGPGVPSAQVLSQGALRTVTRRPAATFLCPPLCTPCITLPPRVIGYSVTVRPRPRPNF
eukprot:s3631_g10.t3